MIVIGLTGSIGTGKTTVTKQFAQCGAATLDSDAVVHRLLAKGGVAVKAVATQFPKAFKDDHIDRKVLGAEVFSDPDKLQKLEAIVHPLVRREQDNFIRKARVRGKKIVVLDIPLLFETSGGERCDMVVVTSAPYAIQRARVLKRPNMTEEKFLRILARQMPDAQKCLLADEVILTGQGKAASLRAVKKIVKRITS